MNDKKTAVPVTKKSPPQSTGGTHLQAAVILFVGCGAALAFRSNGESATAPQPAATEVLVRRAAPPQGTYERPTTQLLGYVETEAAPGVAAQPERRTAAQIDRTAAWSEIPTSPPPAFAGAPTFRTASAGPAPWATMRPFEAASGVATTLTASPANVVRQHTVRDGDTLGDLAERYYGDPRRFRDIFDANRATLADPQLLPIGATLIIPSYDPRVTPPPTDPPAARLAPQGIVPRQ